MESNLEWCVCNLCLEAHFAQEALELFLLSFFYNRKEVCSHLVQGDTDNLDITPQTTKSTLGRSLSWWEMLLHRFHVEGIVLSFRLLTGFSNAVQMWHICFHIIQTASHNWQSVRLSGIAWILLWCYQAEKFLNVVHPQGSTHWPSHPPLGRCTHLGWVGTGSSELTPLATGKVPPPLKAPSYSPALRWTKVRHITVCFWCWPEAKQLHLHQLWIHLQ